MPHTLPSYFSTGSGSAVVLLHSTLSSKNQWRGLSCDLGSEHLVIAPDLYGYGGTPMPQRQEGFGLRDEAELVLALLDRLLPPGEEFHLVGHSYGGAVALWLSHFCPERVVSLAVYEPVAFHLLDRESPGFQEVLAMKGELERLVSAGQEAEAAAAFLDFWSGPGTFAGFPARVQQDFARRTHKLLLDFHSLTSTPFTLDDYRCLEFPVTLLAGRSSRGPALTVARELARVLPDCRLHWVEAGHMGPLTHPELVNPIIRDSLSS